MIKKTLKLFYEEVSTFEFGFYFAENVYEGKRKNLETIEKNA